MAMAGHRHFWWITALGAGLLAGLSLPPLGCPPLLWLALVVLWAQGPRAAALWGGAAVLVSHRWLLWLHPLDWVGVPLPLSLPLCVALLLAIALLAAVLVAFWRWLVERLGPERWSTALLAAALWGLAEVWLAKGPLFWLGLGSVALPGDRALAGLAQLVGAGGLAALQLLLAWGLWRVLALGLAGRKRWWRSGSAWLLLVLALHGLGWQLLQLPAEAAGPVPLLVLQPAIPTRRKFELREQLQLLDRLAQAQRQGALLKASAVLLPEGALALGQPLPEPAAVEVLSGGFRQVEEGQRSALLRFAPGSLQPDGWLEKHRLVPLGEWIPLAGLLQWSGLSAVGGLTPGPPSRLLPRPDGPIAVAICYELSDGSALAAASRDGAQWLMASANLDPYPLMLQRQFTALAQLRAIESGRWLVSAANTGPSLVVDASGQVRGRLPAGQPATALLELRPRAQITGYARWGELPLLLLALVGTIAAVRQRPQP
jgi:apolipoprotein N-acyltransferase